MQHGDTAGSIDASQILTSEFAAVLHVLLLSVSVLVYFRILQFVPLPKNIYKAS